MGTDGRKDLLVVDDEEDFLELVEEILRGTGHEVATARDAHEAARLVSQHAFRVAVIDYRLPGKNGADLAQEIVDASPDTRIVFLTGDSAAARLLGTNGVAPVATLVKPVDVGELLQLLSKLLTD